VIVEPVRQPGRLTRAAGALISLTGNRAAA
jgi:hypothetical protein